MNSFKIPLNVHKTSNSEKNSLIKQAKPTNEQQINNNSFHNNNSFQRHKERNDAKEKHDHRRDLINPNMSFIPEILNTKIDNFDELPLVSS